MLFWDASGGSIETVIHEHVRKPYYRSLDERYIHSYLIIDHFYVIYVSLFLH